MPVASFRSAFLLAVSLSTVALHAPAQSPPTSSDAADPLKVRPVTIQAEREHRTLGSSRLPAAELYGRRAASSDTARLLDGFPGGATYSAGGVSSLPAIRGLADERLKTTVDGMDLMAACPNHMNPVLSYIDPGKVEHVTVFAGIAPVSEGGDNIGGVIQVRSARPQFAAKPGEVLLSAKLGAFTRSNGNARGGSVDVGIADERMNLRYTESRSDADNYRAAGAFKKPGIWQQLGQRPIAPDEVASSGYTGAVNRDLGLALTWGAGSLLQLNAAEQLLTYSGFPNQRMDMIYSKPDPANPGNYVIDTGTPANVNRTVNLRYSGPQAWGELEASLFRQWVRHHMDLNQDRFLGMFMPMKSDADTWGGVVKATIAVAERHRLRLGADFQSYRLDDWWPPVGLAPGAMCCNDFWNIRDGTRDRVGLFSEWETDLGPYWLTLLGIRGGVVQSDAGDVQGYSTTYAADAARFNQLDRRKTDHHLDLTALARFTPDARQTFELGLARKTRSPSLYERYPWSVNPMAALMNNFVGDGNAYIGNPDLKPEVAYSASVSAAWHDIEQARWDIKVTGYANYIEDYIDAQRCPRSLSPQCNALNSTATDRYVILQYANQRALLTGVDLSGSSWLGRSAIGSFRLSGMASYVDGRNLTTDDHHYHLMPLNAKLALQHTLGAWTNTLEVQAVAAKDKVSQVRNEATTPAYSLLNLRTSYAWKHARIDLSLENALNTFYLMPLGGAYLGQGNSMTTGGIPWGMVVPGRGRSFNVAVILEY
jgi:iron complex outermembrane receptor protein